MVSNPDRLRAALLALVPADGTSIGNVRLRRAIEERLGRSVDEDDYTAVCDELVDQGLLLKGQGRGGSVRLTTGVADSGSDDVEASPTLVLESPEPRARGSRKATPKRKGAVACEDPGHRSLARSNRDRRSARDALLPYRRLTDSAQRTNDHPMAHPARVIVRTPPPSLEETARKFGISERELKRVKRLVGRIIARSKGTGKVAVTRPRGAAKATAAGRRPRAK